MENLFTHLSPHFYVIILSLWISGPLIISSLIVSLSPPTPSQKKKCIAQIASRSSKLPRGRVYQDCKEVKVPRGNEDGRAGWEDKVSPQPCRRRSALGGPGQVGSRGPNIREWYRSLAGTSQRWVDRRRLAAAGGRICGVTAVVWSAPVSAGRTSARRQLKAGFVREMKGWKG